MTTVLAPAAPAGPPPPGDGPRAPVLRFADSMHRALDALTETPAWAMRGP